MLTYYLGEFSKSLINYAYTWYVNPKSRMTGSNLVPLSTLNFFYAKENFSIAELGETRQYPGEDLDLMWEDFMKHP